MVRARELFHVAGDNTEEEQALDDTMYALQMLCETHRKLAAALPHRGEAA